MDQRNEIININADLINLIDKIISFLQIQNFDKALRYSTIFINQLEYSLDVIDKVSGNEKVEQLSIYLQDLMEAQKNHDYVLLADLYEIQIRAFFINLQEEIISQVEFGNDMPFWELNRDSFYEKQVELANCIYQDILPSVILKNNYSVEFSSCGLFTLALIDNKGKYYFHSNGRIKASAFALANSWYQEDVVTYIVYGLGFGYHINELYEIDNNITIEIFESDISILKLAAAYIDLRNMLSNKNISIIYDPNFMKLISRIKNIGDDEKFVIHYPSIRNIKDSSIRDKIENYFIQYSSIENQRYLLNGNFRSNIFHYDGLVDELKDCFSGKDLYIVAAGPSLDKNFRQLKQVGKNGIILATGTVFHKLMDAGITPDYVIVTDANQRVYGQVSGLEETGIPLLFLSTANKHFAENYKGRKYMICQKGYDKAEVFAKEKDIMLFQTGGSVSTTALDIGISFGCRRIIFLGLDLAFTDNYVHAEGTSRRNLTNSDDLKQVKDIFGNLIYTSNSLNIYRIWIENRIHDVKDIEIIDATEGGAKIKGMKIMKLTECI